MCNKFTPTSFRQKVKTHYTVSEIVFEIPELELVISELTRHRFGPEKKFRFRSKIVGNERSGSSLPQRETETEATISSEFRNPVFITMIISLAKGLIILIVPK